MRRLIASLTLGLAALALAATASASHNPGNGHGARKDFVRGTAVVQLPTPLGTFPATVFVDAQSEPGGEDPQGTFVTDIDATRIFVGIVHIAGEVTCVNVQGNSGVVGGVITESSHPNLAPLGIGTIGRHVDNGKGKKATAPDEVYAQLTAPPPAAEPCEFPTSTVPVDEGGYTVHQRL